ncbi:DUF2784 domain-containing protein [Photobacterium indicum]|uniref:DUF2784 domain-containing protein n=1 Tax=Photobacterium indicum TaxID=81447 RepID=A0A2T3LA66_9GAMM|nr:DUF2784 domain-containing protein [Photobacterium indicum]PSV48202.1 DUF2784 domain-containing protein [Photobacterium indicum]
MTYLILADLLVLVHLLFIIFVLLGGLLLMLRGSLIFVHLPAVIWATLISFKGWICPLTPLENHLRRVAGSADYEQGFVEHYLIPIIYPNNLTPNIQVMLGIFALLINLSIYCFVYYKRMAKHGGKRV